MKKIDDILAEKIGCEKIAIADTLFPISKGYTEMERIDFMQAIFSSMTEAQNQVINNNDQANVIKSVCDDDLRDECQRRGYVMNKDTDGYDD